VDADVGDRADDEHVADRADAGALPERDPQQQHDGTDGVDQGAEGEAGQSRDALVEDVPGHGAEVGLDHEGHAHAVEGEADVQLHEPAGESFT
jgi:hypothetical protein